MPESSVVRASGASEDSLVSQLVSRIGRIADGNGISASEVRAAEISRVDYPVNLLLEVKLNWRWQSEANSGRFDPGNGSRVMTTDEDARSAIELACNRTVGVEAEAAAQLAELQVDPLQSFETFKDGDRRELPHRFHCHEACGDCAGRGGHVCTCGDGTQQCTNCDYSRPCGRNAESLR